MIIEKIRCFFSADAEENIKRNYIWNTVAGLLDASEAIILSMIVTRVTTLDDAGILSMSFASANLFVTIGKYGVRSYQITDRKGYSIYVYVFTRYITVGLMEIISIGYTLSGIFTRGYSWYKAGCILAMCFIYVVEAFEDVYWGHFQKSGRLDIGAKMFVIRWSGILLTCLIGIIMTQNLLFTLYIACGISTICFILCKAIVIPVIDRRAKIEQIKGVMKDCFPLCVSGFLNFYICNSPKYVIDKYMNDEVQACFGFVAMPVFAVGLLSSFLYQPIIVQLTEDWSKGNIRALVKKISQQLLVIVGISLVCSFGAYLIGTQILSVLYDTNLNKFREELVLMVVGGGCLAIANFESIILIIMRKQKHIIGSYGIAAILSIVLFPGVVLTYQTHGVAVMYDIIVTVLVMMLTCAIFRNLRYQ